MQTLLQGQVISHLGKSIAVEHAQQVILCQSLRKLETVAVGDEVLFKYVADKQGRIEKILPRRSTLKRPSRLGKTRVVAANLDNVYIVFAPEPYCDFLLIDQYLAVCESNNLTAVLVFNKQDLNISSVLETELQDYLYLGYKLHRVSVINEAGMQELQQDLQGHVSIFTGQSGVGKSSLTNSLIPDKDLKTNTVSTITKHGRHTTTAATLYHLPTGGDLIDSPGVAIFGLAGLTVTQLAWGYREFQDYINKCKFHNCRHLKDKGCAVRLAAETGIISPQRYARFLKLITKMQ